MAPGVAELWQWEPPALRVEGGGILSLFGVFHSIVPLQPNRVTAHKGGCWRDPLQWTLVDKVL